LRALVEAPWEGNVRELRNLVESLVVLSPQDEIRLEDLPEEYRRRRATGDVSAATADDDGKTGGAGWAAPVEGLTMEEIERRAILGALERTGGNRTQAAEMLGIGLRTLQRKLKEYRVAAQEDTD
jgi:DNA-binding NtrC family response regulator